MIGRRIDPGDETSAARLVELLTEPGDYLGPVYLAAHPERGRIYYRLPMASVPVVANPVRTATTVDYTFTEEGDGSLSVAELLAAYEIDPTTPVWSGYLDAGHSWRDA